MREDVSKERLGGVPPPEEVSPEREVEIPVAEEVLPPRAAEISTDTQTQASSRNISSPVPGDIPNEDIISPTPPQREERGNPQRQRKRGQGSRRKTEA